mmetsp:Transcript_19125/g.23705  ORF Transcript_19125/g.23705 Transcript_19125/m.23705 type:complete len:445 (-) Transcript_19125:185-1519(-)
MSLSKLVTVYPIADNRIDDLTSVIPPSTTSYAYPKHRLSDGNMEAITISQRNVSPVYPYPTNEHDTIDPQISIPSLETSLIDSNYYIDQKNSSEKNRDKQVEQLQAQGYTTGLINALLINVDKFYQRFWIVDNSGSMQTADGHRFVETEKESDHKMIPCSRWAEIQKTVEYHVEMAGLLRAPTIFRLLNDPGLGKGCQEFSVCERGDDMIKKDIQEARRIMEQSEPRGTTPLARHIREIREQVQDLESFLVKTDKKISIIVATDGLPTDESGLSNDSTRRDFINSIRSLVGLPVWLVIRLCTDDDSVVDFYNALDSQVEMPIEVLDDFISEAKEVHNHNKWVTYSLPLHRCREMGYHHPVFDILDERKLARSELISYCQMLFGNDYFDGVPDPNEDWKGFLKSLDGMLKKEKKQYNPIKGNMRPAIDSRKLNRAYNRRGYFFSR